MARGDADEGEWFSTDGSLVDLGVASDAIDFVAVIVIVISVQASWRLV